jgi:hypothetical protein
MLATFMNESPISHAIASLNAKAVGDLDFLKIDNIDKGQLK